MRRRRARARRICGVLLAGAFIWGLASSLAHADEPSVPGTPGARVLDDPAYAGVDWSAVDRVERLLPDLDDAVTDTPEIYRTDCPVGRDERDFQACAFGAPRAERTVALVGDSKALQWFTPIDRIARRAHWRLVVIGKVGCPFADVVRPVDGRRNLSCEAWGQRALRTLQRLRPDIVLTVTRFPTALPPGASADTTPTAAAMTAGLVRYWRALGSVGVTVVPILDTPGPPHGDSPNCVRHNLERLSACGYPLEEDVDRSGASAQRAAAARLPGTPVVDMTHTICPGQTCPAVIGNVLVYRNGTHLSDSFATSARRALSRKLAAATHGRLGQR